MIHIIPTETIERAAAMLSKAEAVCRMAPRPSEAGRLWSELLAVSIELNAHVNVARDMREKQQRPDA